MAIQNPKSGRAGETVYVPRKILVRLTGYVRAQDIGKKDHIFPVSYVAAWSMVRKAGKMVDIELQRHLGKVNDSEAIRWIETLYG